MKRFLTVLILSILSLGTTLGAFAEDSFQQGKTEFYKKNYGAAQKLFMHELQNNPENYSCRYFLAHTYVYTGDLERAKIEYGKIITFAPTKELQKLAMQSMRNINKPESAVSKPQEVIGDNYYGYIKLKKNYVRWKSFPINVYVRPSEYTNLVKSAFTHWQKVTGGLVQFNFVSDIQSAQITSEMVQALSERDEGFTAGNASIKAKNNIIYSAKIYLLYTNPTTQEPLAPEIIYSTALHEIGHALGLQGHSPSSDDIMSAVNKKGQKSITKRDINTLKLLYR